MAVIEIHGLRKEYRRFLRGTTIAVSSLDLEVPEGGVFGFLGPNGAGKTTTIRCLLGLVKPTKGSLRLLGADVSKDLPSVIRRVGSIVETPSFFPRFSGRRNLSLLGRLQGVGPKTVTATLERVGLGERADDIVKTYSLGMKQRLGIGAALLKEPDVLVLDEPANGLDPAGIVEVRQLLRTLGAEGRTIFVSSHQLSEIQQMADRVAILARGECITAGPVADVLSAGRAQGVVVKLEDPKAGVEALTAAGFDAVVDRDVIRVKLPPSEAARVTRALAERGLFLSELRTDEVDLETVFLELTGDPTP